MMFVLFLSVTGVWCLIYAILCRRKITMYTKHNINIMNYSIFDSEAFMKAQFDTSIFVAMCYFLIAVAAFVYLLKRPDSNIVSLAILAPLLQHLANYSFVQYSVRKGYLVKNK